MKAIMVMYDTLARNWLEPYGRTAEMDPRPQTPNFTRLAEHSATFDTCYAGSMPCMPARRELHAGRYNFLHRSWGPIEPFDDSAPELLREAGIYTHLVSDHAHYWEDGGATYHTRYESWECTRGQEGDPWKAYLGCEPIPSAFDGRAPANPIKQRLAQHDAMNRRYIGVHEERMPQHVTFSDGLSFIEDNADKDDWFLQIETFDPHEPFFVQEEFDKLIPGNWAGPSADWPPYNVVTESGELVYETRRKYAALIGMCDAYLGRVLDAMDRHGLWDDTLLIVNTDHGFLLGEHGWWGKGVMPLYDDIIRTPLFIWDPRSQVKGVHRSALVQTIDLPATLLDYFGVSLPSDMQGRPLSGVIECDEPVREFALYGMHGNYTCVTDGHNTYLRAPATMDGRGSYEYTLMPTHMRCRFSPEELREATLVEPFSFTKGCPVLRVPMKPPAFSGAIYGSKLFCTDDDPDQRHELDDSELEVHMARGMVRLMHETDAPREEYARLGLPEDEADITVAMLREMREKLEEERTPAFMRDWDWEHGAANIIYTLVKRTPEERRGELSKAFESFVAARNEAATRTVATTAARAFLDVWLDPSDRGMFAYFTDLLCR